MYEIWELLRKYLKILIVYSSEYLYLPLQIFYDIRNPQVVSFFNDIYYHYKYLTRR